MDQLTNAPSVEASGSATSAGVVIDAMENAWRDPVIKRLEHLVRLPQGWDGYQARPVGLAEAAFALRLLEATCGAGAVSPQIVPGVGGDLQIEWHTDRGDIELHVRATNSVHAWLNVVGASPREEELELTNEFSKVAAWVKEITEPLRALTSAAA